MGGGAPGDGTVLLAELLRQGATDTVVMIADPEAVGVCLRAGVRETVTLAVGGKVDRLHGAPQDIRISTRNSRRNEPLGRESWRVGAKVVDLATSNRVLAVT